MSSNLIPFDSTPSTSTSVSNSSITLQPLDLHTLLSEHSNDYHLALLHLISEHNDLIKQHLSLQSEKEKSSAENNQLWRTLRAASSRQHLPDSNSRENSTSNSIRGSINSNNSTSRKPFLENNNGTNSRAQLQLPVATINQESVHSQSLNLPTESFDSTTQLPLPVPDLNSSSGSSSSTSSLRKGVSLDLIRPTYRDNSSHHSPHSLSSARSVNDMSSLTNNIADSSSTYLPQITPVSPLNFLSNPSSSRLSPLPSPSLSLPDSSSPNSSTHQSYTPETLYQSLPLPSFPSSPSKLSPTAPLSPPPSSADSMTDPHFERQQHSTSNSTTSTILPLRLPSRPILSPHSLPFSTIQVASSNLSLTDKGKETTSFFIDVTVNSKTSSNSSEISLTSWKIEKLYSEIVKLDSLIRSKINRQELKTLRPLPDKALFKDHSPHKSDQRKAILERYLQGLTSISSVDNMIICAFFNSDVVPENSTTISKGGVMEGWLSKRGKSFAGWQTRFYVLSSGSLSYYESKDGIKLGEIDINQASIGRQSSRSTEFITDDSYLHAFLIRTIKTSDDKDQEDHILCSETDEFRDAWVTALTSIQAQPQPQLSSLSSPLSTTRPALATIPSFETPTNDLRSPEAAAENRRHNRKQSITSIHSLQDSDQYHPSRRAASSDLPLNSASTSNFIGIENIPEKRSTSELGYHLQDDKNRSISRNTQDQRIHRPPPSQIQSERPITPEPKREKESSNSNGNGSKFITSNVSGPMNAVSLPTGYQFKPDRSKKTKSSFWNFSHKNTNTEKSTTPAAVLPPSRPVFGVSLKEAVAISQIRPGLALPCVVYRLVEYLEAKNAELEEGIYRLSGSTNSIKALKDRFNLEGDVNLLASPVYYDLHCVAGLLKLYFRELPVHILTRELYPEFIKVIELRERNDRIQALTHLVAKLPIENYTVFRFFFAHLCVIAQSEVSKMGLRNLGIVFSPTLAMPAPLFSLLLSEFDTVFAVEQPVVEPIEEEFQSNRRPNSVIYTASNANYLMEGGVNRLLGQEEEDEEDEYHSVAAPLEENDAANLLVLHDSAFENTNIGNHNNHSSSPNSMHVSNTPRSATVTIPTSPRPGVTFLAQTQ